MPVTKISNVGRHLHDAFLSPDGRYLLVSSYDDNLIASIDLADMRIVKKIPAGCKPQLCTCAQAGKRFIRLIERWK